MDILKWLKLNRYEAKMKKLLHQGVGQHSAQWKAADPDAEQQFITWMEGRRRLARRPIKETLVQLRLVSVPKEAMEKYRNGAKDISGVMEEQGYEFTWEEYSKRHDTLKGMFQKAKNIPNTEIIMGILVDTGDLFERSLRDIENKLGGKKQ